MNRYDACAALTILHEAIARVSELRGFVDGAEQSHVRLALKELLALAGPSSPLVLASGRGRYAEIDPRFGGRL